MDTKEESFLTYQGSECLISCFYNYFKNCNITIEESDIFFIGNGFTTSYEKNISGAKTKISLRTNVHEAIEEFLKKYHVRFERKKVINEQQAQEILLRSLEKSPVIVKADAGFLSYDTIFKGAKGVTHYFLVVGFRGEELLISDGFVPRVPPSSYQGWISANQLKPAREVKNYECIIIDGDSLDLLKSSWSGTWPRELFCENVYKGLELYLTGSMDNHKYYGMKALQEFSNDLPGFLDLFGDNFMEKMKMFNNQIRLWGLMTSRILLEKALLKMIDEGLFCLSNSLVGEMKNINKKWNNFCFMLIKVGLTKKYEDINLLTQQLNEIIKAEEGLFNKILAYR